MSQKITLSAGGQQVTALRGQTAPSLTDGFGGWSVISRPHRKALTEWVGVNPLSLVFSLIFDASINPSVEAACLKLEQMAQPAGTSQPPVVTVTGDVPHADVAWVIGNLAWDASPVYTPAGDRLRQEVTVTLLERVAADLIPSAAATARSHAAAGSKPYVVKKGDTLLTIAASQLGDYTRWNAIASLNGLRDPNRLTVGQRLRLP